VTDPVLHEPTIMDTLDCRVDPGNASRLQTAALLSLIDAYDRRLTRENFLVLAEAALGMHTQIGKLYMMASVADNYNLGVLDDLMVERAVNGTSAMAVKAHDELYGLMKKVVMCPTSDDKVN
jgi:hypothetical protein